MRFDCRLPARAEAFRVFAADRKNRKNIAVVVIAALALIAVQTVKGLPEGKKYISDSDGSIVGLYRDDSSRTASYPLRVEIKGENGVISRDIIMTLQGETADAGPADDKGETLEEQLSDMIYEAETSKGRKVMLPAALGDGTSLEWSRNTAGDPMPILVAALMAVIMLYWNSRRRDRAAVLNREDSVRRALPSFNGQLLMLVRSGLIFNDAFIRIADGYEKRGTDGDYFRESIVEIRKRSAETGRSLVLSLNDFAARAGVREFSRMAGIITDNQVRGTDFAGKLESESEILWNRRKKMAEEKGRLAETRLTVPLAVLLVVLILITAAPAILQVKGG